MLFIDPEHGEPSAKNFTNDGNTVTDCSTLPRRDGRSLVFHLLYAMDSFDYQVSLESIADNLGRGFQCHIDVNGSLFKEAQGIIVQRDYLDSLIKPLLDNWRFDRLGVCTRLIVRLALWELINTDTTHSIVINEAVELAKCFGELDSYKFINGILDEWVKRSKEGEPGLKN
ncbi:MAG TPA: transcription antitermination factor NusB [Candidatus Babeliaceae bacterium]|nr:transcription antitermination factor NusB [Candidatus Babeliaceae bacterium]